MAEESLSRELYAGIEVLKSQQSEINRRLGIIEKKLEDEDSAADEKRDTWWTWAIQTVGQILLVSVVLAGGKSLGIELSW